MMSSSSITVTRTGGRRSQTTTVLTTTTSLERVSGDLPDLSQWWFGDLTPDNIRLTALGSERTGYTYAESGGYRSDRLKDKWRAPNLSRTTLGSSVEGFTSQRESEAGFSNINQTLDMLTRNRSGKDTRTSHTLTKKYTSSPIDQESVSDGHTQCLRHLGEWCLHTDCAVMLERSSGANAAVERRNSTTTSSSVDTNKLFESLPLSFESEDRGGVRSSTRRRSSRLSRTPIDRVTRGGRREPEPAAPPVCGLPAASVNTSTYVYSSGLGAVSRWPDSGDGPDSQAAARLPQPRSAETDQVKATGVVASSRLANAPTEHRQGGWLTKSIFGLEKTSALHQTASQRRRSTGAFVSSDTEDTVDGDRRGTRSSSASQWRAGLYQPGRPHTYASRLYQSTLGPVSAWLSETGRQLCNRLSHFSVQLLAFLLVLVYTCLGLLFQAGYWLFRKVHLWTQALISRKRAPASSQRRSFLVDYRHAGLHPRLSEFHRLANSTEETEQQRINNNNTLSDVGSLCQYRWLTNRVASRLCLLLPLLLPLLLLLLPFLLAPIASDTSQQGKWWAFVLPDAKCLQTVVARPEAEDYRVWSTAAWRTRCLYQHYLATNASTSDGGGGSGGLRREWSRYIGTFFTSIRQWFASREEEHLSTAHSSSFNMHVDQNNHSQLLNDLVSFTSAVNQRLDLLSRSVLSTDRQLSSLAARLESTDERLRSQVSNLEASLSRETHHWDKWHREIQLAVAQLKATGPNLDGGGGLVQAVLSATNATISQQMASVYRQLLEDQGHLGRETNATLLELSLLVTTLRQQMSSRMKQAEQEIEQLRLHLDNNFTGQKTDDTVMTTALGELHKTVHVLSERLNHLEKANNDAERFILKLNQNIQRCQDDQTAVTEHCQKTTFHYVNSAITSLSHRLSNDVSQMINETLANELPAHLVNSNLWADLHVKVKQMTLEAVDQAIGRLKLQHSTVHLADGVADVQAMIEAALNRFAADRTGMADFALESAGGAVVGTRCTRTYTDGAALFSLFGIPLARLTNSARTILQSGNNPGDCWPFHGSTGHVVIRLATPVLISAVSLEHLPRNLAPNGRLDSAPKEFVIKGLASESDEDGVELGRFVYDTDGSPIQTFFLPKPADQPHQYVELHVLSNHGHPLYTCVYRLRVHGKMAS